MRTIQVCMTLMVASLVVTPLHALTLVWDFDSTVTQTVGLEAGALDGDTTAPEWWRPDPEHPGRIPYLTIQNGILTQTYDNLAEGSTPNDGSSAFHTTSLFAGQNYNGQGTALGLNFPTAPYLMIGGEIGWSTDTEVGGEIYLLLNGDLWFQNSFTVSSANVQAIPTNTAARHVIDFGQLTASGALGAYDGGTIDGMMFDVFGIWTSPTTSRPASASAMWITEFDNDPNVTYLRWDWVAFTDDPNFRSSYLPVELADFSAE